MNNYEYINPLNKGFKKFKLNKKQHNSFFKYRQTRWFDRYEYYYNEQEIEINRFYNKKAIN
jgi:hypothetical protein